MKLAELYNKGMQQKTSPQEPEQPNKPNKSNVNIIVKFPEVSALIKHLDMLYSKMLAGEVAEIASEPNNNPKQKVIVGQTDAIVLDEKEAYFNPGNSAVTESM